MDKDKLVKTAHDLGIVRRDVAENFVETVYEESKKTGGLLGRVVRPLPYDRPPARRGCYGLPR